MIFHLAGVVSGEAEADFSKGYRANLDGTRALFDAIRLREGYVPRIVYASSIAVFGAPFPHAIPDDFQPVPLTSYGTQKLIGELLLTDFTRRGFMDGIALRLPTICVRPGKPNRAASGFFSSIIREPLAGRQAILPVSRDVVHTHASPRSAVGFLLHAAALSLRCRRPAPRHYLAGRRGQRRRTDRRLARIAGDAVVALIREEPDPAICRHRRQLAAAFRGEARTRTRLRRRNNLRRHHPHSYRGSSWAESHSCRTRADSRLKALFAALQA